MLCLENGLGGKLGKVAYLERWITTISPMTARETQFIVTFEWDDSMGLPGAFMIKNHHHSQFYLKTVTLDDVPGHGRVHFVCNSWVYPADRYKYNRIFFSNEVSSLLIYMSKRFCSVPNFVLIFNYMVHFSIAFSCLFFFFFLIFFTFYLQLLEGKF